MRVVRIPHRLALLTLASAGWASTALAAPPPMTAPVVAAEIRNEAGGKIKSFYAERAYRPLWTVKGRIGPAADTLLGYLESADVDGLKPSRYGVKELRQLVADARGGDPRALARAEVELSATFARYVRDIRSPGKARMEYSDPALKPRKLQPEAVLRAAAMPRSFDDYMSSMGWMSPHYARIREMLADAASGSLRDAELRRLRLNLDRARLLPPASVRHIVVDAASARLWYYQAGKQVGTMRVVVGAVETQTPVIAGSLNYAILAPYWNIPTYLARKSIAPKVLAGRSLESLRMEVLSDWTANARTVDPSTVDWRAVASGQREIRLRERPGPLNSMGKVKFVFPNDHGIYLHDTPNRDLFGKSDRHLSNGCIRLENAAVLGKWLLGKPVTTSSKNPEQAVPLPSTVPVYLTYLTATPTKKGVAFLEDVYSLDSRAPRKGGFGRIIPIASGSARTSSSR